MPEQQVIRPRQGGEAQEVRHAAEGDLQIVGVVVHQRSGMEDDAVEVFAPLPRHPERAPDRLGDGLDV